MDESWRVNYGSKLPRRKSTEDYTGNFIDPEEFKDVFGGPPRSVIFRQKIDSGLGCHQFTGDRIQSVFDSDCSSFYDEVFRPISDRQLRTDLDLPPFEIPARRSRNLPVFNIPSVSRGKRNGEKFCNKDSIWRVNDDNLSSYRGSRSRSKSNSSSFPSSESLSPLRASSTGDDSVLSSFASKLRPINVRSRQNPSTFSGLIPDYWRHENSAVPSVSSSFMEFTEPFMDKFNHKNRDTSKFNDFHFAFHSQNSPSETMVNFEPNYSSHNISATPNPSEESGDDGPDINSPTAISILGHGPETRTEFSQKSFREDDEEEEEEEEEAESEFLASYVIEIEPDKREDQFKETGAVDEAIAWAKEKFQNGKIEFGSINSVETAALQHNSMEVFRDKDPLAEPETLAECPVQPTKDCGRQQIFTKAFEELEGLDSDGETEQTESDMAMKLLDEDIKRWSAGKEGNIRTLLSTLQYILWANSGWHPIPLVDIIETSCVRKAYQKARLCLHPDKLQQKGAIPLQKYLAQKVFTILQDAWMVFNSQDVFSG